MTKIDIFSGFLGAGKTTLIKKLIKEAYAGEKLVLIENEFGQIGIDGGFLKDSGIEITEMNSGCICCSLVGDFSKSLKEVLHRFSPDRILIEPSGVGKLSDIAEAVANADDSIIINGMTAVVDAAKCKMYMKNFGEFFNNQIESATTIVLSHTAKCSPEKIEECIALIKEHNDRATLVVTEWDSLSGKQILDAIEQNKTLSAEMEELMKHEHHGDDDDDDCCCGHHHHDDDDEHEHHHHHHHDDDDDECCHGHHHDDDDDDDDDHGHHHHDGECCHGHHHHHHHDADEVFSSVGIETMRRFTKDEVTAILNKLNSGDYGNILRAKGIIASDDAEWIHFDFVPDEPDVRNGSADIIGRICVIGAELHEDEIKELFK